MSAQILQPGLLERVEARISEVASEAPQPLAEMAIHLLSAGGKRLRPQVVLLTSRIGGKTPDGVVELAVAAELVHNASLLHDDVIDEAAVRRGKPAVRAVWGNAYSVLAGDHLMTRALEIIDDVAMPDVLRSMLRTLRRLVAAEMIQLAHRGKLVPDPELYYGIVRGKTASLFGWCADAGARAGGADEVTCRSLREYGEEMGIAFQLFDDLLDLEGSSRELGKSLFTDIAQGVATLPVILASQREPSVARELLDGFQRGTSEDMESIARSVRRWVRENGGVEETGKLAREHVENALQALEPLRAGPEKVFLEGLARSMVDRRR